MVTRAAVQIGLHRDADGELTDRVLSALRAVERLSDN